MLRGMPESITTDNGGAFAGKAMETWAYKNSVKLDLIRPGKPFENACIETCNGRLRDECLNGEAFFDLADARENKATPKPRQGFAAAGQNPPALDTAASSPSGPQMRAKGLAERPRLLERIT